MPPPEQQTASFSPPPKGGGWAEGSAPGWGRRVSTLVPAPTDAGVIERSDAAGPCIWVVSGAASPGALSADSAEIPAASGPLASITAALPKPTAGESSGAAANGRYWPKPGQQMLSGDPHDRMLTQTVGR